MRALSLVVVAALVLAACGGSSKPRPASPAPVPPAEEATPQPIAVEPPPPALPPVPSTPAPAPDGLVATGSTPPVALMLPTLAGYLEHVQPGLGSFATLEQLVAMAAHDGTDLAGIDHRKPVRALLLDPGRYREPLVIVLGIGDPQVLARETAKRDLRYQTRNGFAAIGSFEALSAAGGYALTTLLDAPAAPIPQLDVDLGYLWTRYGGVLEAIVAGAAQGMPDDQRALVEPMMRGLVARLAQIDRAQVTLDVRGDHASVVLRVVPVAGSGLAAFAASRKPATFARVTDVPEGALAVGGRVDLGPMLADFMDALEPLMTRMYGTGAADMIAASRRWAAVELGELGGSVRFDPTPGKSSMSMLMDVADPAALAIAWRETAAAQAKARGAFLEAKAGTLKYRGLKLSTLTLTPSASLPPEQRAGMFALGPSNVQVFGVIGKTALLGFGPDGAGAARVLVDVLRGGKKARPSSGFAAAIELARGRGESFIVTLDLPAFMAFDQRRSAPPGTTAAAGPVALSGAEPVSIGFGADGALALRLTLPAAQVGATIASVQAAVPPAP